MCSRHRRNGPAATKRCLPPFRSSNSACAAMGTPCSAAGIDPSIVTPVCRRSRSASGTRYTAHQSASWSEIALPGTANTTAPVTETGARRGSAAQPMDDATRVLEAATWAAAEGIATADQLALLQADPRAWRLMLERLLDETEDSLDAVREHGEPQAVADFEEELARLEAAYDLLTRAGDPTSIVVAADPAGEVRLQASWANRQIVVWAAGPDTIPADNDELADRL